LNIETEKRTGIFPQPPPAGNDR